MAELRSVCATARRIRTCDRTEKAVAGSAQCEAVVADLPPRIICLVEEEGPVAVAIVPFSILAKPSNWRRPLAIQCVIGEPAGPAIWDWLPSSVGLMPADRRISTVRKRLVMEEQRRGMGGAWVRRWAAVLGQT